MSFDLKRNLLLIAFIIAIIGGVWLLVRVALYAFSAFQGGDVIAPNNVSNNVPDVQKVSYVEKINNLALQEFDANAQISHFIEAKHYFSFKDAPALLLSPKITLYDAQSVEDYVLLAKRANYFDNGDIKFSGKVDIRSSNGVSHQMNTQELLVGADTKDLISHKKVTYLGEGVKIIARGMHMKSKQNEMKLLGDTQILQDGGQKILTKELNIDEVNQKKHYYSKHKTTYISVNNKVYAQAMDMNTYDEVVNLLGKVKIVQNSGSEINTRNLVADQSNNHEIYHTREDIHYQSKVADIRAKGMRYDVKNQKIKLTGGVVGRYE